MNAHPHSDKALREALSRLAARQVSPPEGMTDRFMARMAQQQAERTPADTSVQAEPKPARRVLKLRWWGYAAAAVVLLAWVIFPREQVDEEHEPLTATLTVDSQSVSTHAPSPTNALAEPVAQLASDSPSHEAPVAPQTASQSSNPVRTVRMQMDDATAMAEVAQPAAAVVDEPIAEPVVVEANDVQPIAVAVVEQPAATTSPEEVVFTAHELALSQQADNFMSMRVAYQIGETMLVQRRCIRQCLNTPTIYLQTPTINTLPVRL
ncbi:MAG: hypothetical protein IJ786_03020 [Bacteroidaceae bacterium]|nr:hypothetical protein [Bacteroidaceae bacterium]